MRRPDFRQELHRDEYHRLRRATMMRTNARRTVPYRPAAHTPYGHYAAKITNYGSGGKNRTLGPHRARVESRANSVALSGATRIHLMMERREIRREHYHAASCDDCWRAIPDEDLQEHRLAQGASMA